MNIEFEYKLRKAEDAADEFCRDVLEKGDFSLLSKDEKVQKLYLAAMNECAPGSKEDKELLINNKSTEFIYIKKHRKIRL